MKINQISESAGSHYMSMAPVSFPVGVMLLCIDSAVLPPRLIETMHPPRLERPIPFWPPHITCAKVGSPRDPVHVLKSALLLLPLHFESRHARSHQVRTRCSSSICMNLVLLGASQPWNPEPEYELMARNSVPV